MLRKKAMQKFIYIYIKPANSKSLEKDHSFHVSRVTAHAGGRRDREMLPRTPGR